MINNESMLINKPTMYWDEFLLNLYKRRFFILLSGMLFGLIAIAIIVFMPNEYASNVIIAVNPDLNYGEKNSSDIPYVSLINKEEALIKTSYILKYVIVKDHLNIQIFPHYFPIIGHLFYKYDKTLLSPPVLGLKKYAWGGELITFADFEFPEKSVTQTFKLIKLNNDTYKLLGKNDELLITGKLGYEYKTDSGIKLNIKNIVARPGMIFTIKVNSPDSVLEDLKKNLKMTNVTGNDDSVPSGMFQLQLIYEDPHTIMKIINDIANYTIIKSQMDKQKELDGALAEIDSNLADIKAHLIYQTNQLNQYRHDLSFIDSSMLGQQLYLALANAQHEMNDLKSKRSELLQLYKKKHPLLLANEAREISLTKEILDIQTKINELPIVKQKESEYINKINSDQTLYDSLLSYKNRFEIERKMTISTIKILSAANLPIKINRNKLFIYTGSFFLGIWFAITVIYIRSLLKLDR